MEEEEEREGKGCLLEGNEGVQTKQLGPAPSDGDLEKLNGPGGSDVAVRR